MLSDPLAVTYNSVSVNLPRVSAATNRTVYRTADGEFVVSITKTPSGRTGQEFRSISLGRVLPDPTPSNSFDDYRVIKNEFTLSYGFDSTRAETSVDIPRLRTALLALVDSTLQGRLIAGET
jgi:hypothetical protein